MTTYLIYSDIPMIISQFILIEFLPPCTQNIKIDFAVISEVPFAE